MNATTLKDDSAADPHARIDQLETRAVLSGLWLFVLLNLIFRDIHEIVKAEFLTDALNGIYDGREVTDVMFLVGGLIVEVPIVMMLMAWILPITANRRANVATASLFALAVVTAVPGDLDDYLHSGLELLALVAIIWKAWSWEATGVALSDECGTSSKSAA